MVSGSDAWAVGATEFPSLAFAIHWEGTKWSLVRLPRLSRPSAAGTVLPVGPSEVWALGVTGQFQGGNATVPHGRALAELWDGKSWKVLLPARARGGLGGSGLTPDGMIVAGTGAGDIATLCPELILGGSFVPRSSTLRFGQWMTWRVPTSDQSPHGVADATGLGLFDSGSRTPGSAFAYRFPVAGSFAIVDDPTGHKAEVHVLPSVKRVKGGFQVSWATRVPEGLRADVQVRTPWGRGFWTWKRGVNTSTSTFTTARTGSFLFRARLRRPDAIAASDWSPAVAGNL
jgi:hypothetical protein